MVKNRSIVVKAPIVPGLPAFRLDRYQPKNKLPYSRWIISCPWHEHCKRKKTTSYTSTFGTVQPIAYLAAWAQCGEDVSQEEHSSRVFHVPLALEKDWSEKLLANDVAKPMLDLLL